MKRTKRNRDWLSPYAREAAPYAEFSKARANEQPLPENVFDKVEWFGEFGYKLGKLKEEKENR